MLNTAQRDAVRKLGFGSSILHLDIIRLPERMNYWLLENFDPVSREIQLQHVRRIRIVASDVSVIYDFPKGPRKIEKSLRNQKCNVMPKNELVSSTLSDETAGEWFKMNFMILVFKSMIENTEDGYVFQNLMDCLDEIDNVSQYDWCDYILRALVDHTVKWKRDKKMPYTGPILFLLMMYLDRVAVYFREVPRYIPTFYGWNYFLLECRQTTEIAAGDFGGGYPWPAYTRAQFLENHGQRCSEREEIEGQNQDVAASAVID